MVSGVSVQSAQVGSSYQRTCTLHFNYICVGGTRTQPLICVGCSVHHWVSCTINKRGFFRECICRQLTGQDKGHPIMHRTPNKN